MSYSPVFAGELSESWPVLADKGIVDQEFTSLTMNKFTWRNYALSTMDILHTIVCDYCIHSQDESIALSNPLPVHHSLLKHASHASAMSVNVINATN